MSISVEWSAVDIDHKVNDNEVMIVVSDLTTTANYHFVWNRDKLPNVPQLRDDERAELAHRICKKMHDAQHVAGNDEKFIIDQLQKFELVTYVQGSRGWEMMNTLGQHNTLYLVADYNVGCKDSALRVLGSTSSADLREAVGSGLNGAIAMGARFFEPTKDAFHKSGFTMMETVTPGSRINGFAVVKRGPAYTKPKNRKKNKKNRRK